MPPIKIVTVKFTDAEAKHVEKLLAKHRNDPVAIRAAYTLSSAPRRTGKLN